MLTVGDILSPHSDHCDHWSGKGYFELLMLIPSLKVTTIVFVLFSHVYCLPCIWLTAELNDSIISLLCYWVSDLIVEVIFFNLINSKSSPVTFFYLIFKVDSEYSVFIKFDQNECKWGWIVCVKTPSHNWKWYVFNDCSFFSSKVSQLKKKLCVYDQLFMLLYRIYKWKEDKIRWNFAFSPHQLSEIMKQKYNSEL